MLPKRPRCTSATSRVAARVPRTRAREFDDTLLEQLPGRLAESASAGQPMPRWWSSQARAASTCGAKLVAGGSTTSAGRTQAGSLLAAMPAQPGWRHSSCCCSRKAVKISLRRASARNSPSRCMIWLISSSAWAKRSLSALGTAMPQGTGSKPNFRSKRDANAGFAEIGREEAVVLRGEEAGLVLQAARQPAGIVEQQQSRSRCDTS